MLRRQAVSENNQGNVKVSPKILLDNKIPTPKHQITNKSQISIINDGTLGKYWLGLTVVAK